MKTIWIDKNMVRSSSRLVRRLWQFGPLCSALLFVTSAAAEDGVLDSLIYYEPELPTPKIVRVFPDNLVSPWIVALRRPEADLQRQAAVTIALAHQHGLLGLEAAVDPLLMVLEKPGHPFVRLAAAQALVELDARQAAGPLFEQAKAGDQRLHDIIEPALARWKYRPAIELWLERLGRPETSKADLLLAIQGLGQLEEPRAVPRLTELLHSSDEPWVVRLEAAHALGAIRATGSEPDARRLLASEVSDEPGSPAGRNRRIAAAWLLRRHQGDDAVRLLQDLARESEPAVAGIALERLLEIDSKLVQVAAVDSVKQAHYLPAICAFARARLYRFPVRAIQRGYQQCR